MSQSFDSGLAHKNRIVKSFMKIYTEIPTTAEIYRKRNIQEKFPKVNVVHEGRPNFPALIVRTFRQLDDPIISLVAGGSVGLGGSRRRKIITK